MKRQPCRCGDVLACRQCQRQVAEAATVEGRAPARRTGIGTVVTR